MFTLTYWNLFAIISIAWVAVRIIIAAQNHKVDLLREVKLLTVYICIIVIARIVYFPWHLENGHIGVLHFNAQKILPLWVNVVPLVHLFDIYEGWQRNLFGNIAMFIPVGLAWPFCFKKLDGIGKVVLAGAGFSLLIELSQLFFYERGSDIDDLITNTTGVLIGATVYFMIIRVRKMIADR